jgi:hypothetical protein
MIPLLYYRGPVDYSSEDVLDSPKYERQIFNIIFRSFLLNLPFEPMSIKATVEMRQLVYGRDITLFVGTGDTYRL